MTLCPVCGAQVGVEPPAEPLRESLQAAVLEKREVPVNGSNGTAVAEAPVKATVYPEEDRTPAPAPEVVKADASVILPAAGSPALPAPARPLTAPLILGAMALTAAVMIPVTLVFESHPILGILGFCFSGFLVPFAPIAWIAGLSAEKRRREQNLRPERRVVVGRLLGQIGTLLLVAEVTLALILVAGLRLSGSFPSSFWKTPQLW